MMVKGNIYKFYGSFERGEILVGTFDSFDKTTGFLVFNNVVLKRDCEKKVNSLSSDAKRKIAEYLNGGEATNCVGKFGAEAEKQLMNWFEGGELPKGIILHHCAMYGTINSIIPMKNYFEEV